MSANSKKIENKKLDFIIRILDLYEFINSLEDNVETLIGENGSRISGGQKQRIGIARALYNSPDLIILDEATNSIDQQTQNLILNNIFKEFKNLSIICISHDIKVLNKFKTKLTLRNGRIYKK